MFLTKSYKKNKKPYILFTPYIIYTRTSKTEEFSKKITFCYHLFVTFKKNVVTLPPKHSRTYTKRGASVRLAKDL